MKDTHLDRFDTDRAKDLMETWGKEAVLRLLVRTEEMVGREEKYLTKTGSKSRTKVSWMKEILRIVRKAVGVTDPEDCSTLLAL